ncbi:NAD(P)-binding protein [Zopfia rhizophila CBS 207.26]|uniref:NAD(P)-binding protein n=1 Tax=Zopfia rhizophila CBS 207.26 TaxID=1314779 RepID=A0A6A6E6U1_9PEZI|nr:NAD(P)-binding protein [Zopfia rhizophila CBS 207.26]
MAGKTALISGSSKGIGAAIALELSSPICADLSTTEGPEELVRQAVERFKYIDVLVNNAGLVPLAPLWDADVESWDKAMALNARGTFLLTKAVLPHLTPYLPSSLPRLSGVLNGSRIIIVGSAASRTPNPSQGVYAATKGALDAMLKVWAKELPPKYGCTVNAVGPGPVLNDNFTSLLIDDFEKVRQQADRLTPVEGAFASIEDIAWAVAFLAEERSRWINGVYLPLSGGRYILQKLGRHSD